jgi:hypothetical protein
MPTLEAKPHRHSLVVRPPELHHYRPSSGEPRSTADVVPPMPTARPFPFTLRVQTVAESVAEDTPSTP